MNTPLAGIAGRVLFLTLCFAVICVGSSARASGADTYDFSPPSASVQRVKTTLQVQGKLKLLGPDNKERQIPLEVSGNFVYDEKTNNSSTLWSSRYYQTAEAEIRLDKANHQPRLSDDRRLVGVRMESTTPRFWSPGGPLSRDEVELIDVQGNSLSLSGLLPADPIKIGDTWQPDETFLAGFLSIHALNANQVNCKLAEVKDGRAVVEMAGKASGAVEGVPTEIELSAKYSYHLAERRFISLAMAWKENRTIGQAEPGFEVSARMTMVLTPLAASDHLTNKTVAGMELGLGMAPPLRHESTEQGFRVLLDPRWRAIIERPEVTVLRLIDNGETVAQCNVSSLPPLEAGRRLQLEEFQRDIQKALGENFGQFLEASQSETDHGLRVLRVTAAGEASELPIHWIYYHVSDDQDRRLTYVFTLEAEKAERFAGADAPFTSSLELFAPAPTAQPDAAAAKEARR